jgi:curved DNA-binding protein CbpA
MRDLYADLGVHPSATDEEIRSAWREKAMQSHTDRGGNAEAFMNARAAYETLRDPKLRAAYDGARSGNVDPKISRTSSSTWSRTWAQSSPPCGPLPRPAIGSGSLMEG